MDPLKQLAGLGATKKASSLFEEFKKFAFKGNVVDLAIGVIIGAAFGAIENFTRNLAQDVSPCGVRVICVRTAATPETRTMHDLQASMTAAMNIPQGQVFKTLADMTLLKVSPTIADMARAAVFAASDDARMMTGTVLNASAGATLD